MKLLALALALPAASAANTFLTVGDWGGTALGAQYKTNVYDTASAMADAATATGAQWVIGTGDNFYWCGITSLEDFQIATDFEEPYADPSLQVPWYHALGNHEYGYNVTAQILYSNVSAIWNMDDRYYTRRFEIGSTGSFVSLVVIDTSPCISAYRSDDKSGWDPCGTEWPTCSLDSTDDDFEGECQFHDNILTQDCATQLTWFQNALDQVPEDDWLIVVGHHPIDEVDVEDFTTVLQNHGFDLYLNGHTHSLVHYTVDNAGAYITSGAGAMVDTADQHSGVTAAKVKGEDIPARRGGNGTMGHSYQTVWHSTVAGFNLHTFSDDLTQLTSDFVTYEGETVHSFTVTKRSATKQFRKAGGSTCTGTGEFCCEAPNNDVDNCPASAQTDDCTAIGACCCG